MADNNWLGLTGKVCVVTGAVGGMGTKICEEFAKQGANVVLVDLLADKVTAYANELATKYGVKTLALTCDTTNEARWMMRLSKWLPSSAVSMFW